MRFLAAIGGTGGVGKVDEFERRVLDVGWHPLAHRDSLHPPHPVTRS